MSVVETEEMIDALLVYMNERVENEGRSIGSVFFDFDEGSQNFNNICADQGWTKPSFRRILNMCRSRKLIEKKTLGRGDNSLVLTNRGQERAISSLVSQESKNTETKAMYINNITVNGPAQVGNGNKQNLNSDKKTHSFLAFSFSLLRHPMVVGVVCVILAAIFGYFKS